MDIGLGHVTVRSIARDRSSATRVARSILGVKSVWVGIGLLLMLVSAPLLRSDPAVIRACYLLGLSAALRSTILTIRGVLQGLDRFDLEAATVVADRVLLLVLGLASLWAGLGVSGLAAAFVVSRLLLLALVVVLTSRRGGVPWPSYEYSAWGDIHRAALPLGVFMIAINLLSYVDTIMLGILRTNEETGLYAAAYRVYEGLTYVPSILSAVLTPRLSSLFVHDRAAVRRLLVRSLGLSALLGLVLGGALILVATPVVTLLFGRDYAASTAPLQILSAGAVFAFCTWVLHAAAIATNLDRQLLGVTAASLGTNVVLNLVLIPAWGISGAAFATVVAEALTVSMLLRQIFRVLRSEPAPAAVATGPREFGNRHANVDFLDQTGALTGPRDVLEVGLGTGALLQFLRERGHRVHGVDTNPELLDEARRWFGSDLPVQLVAGTGLPFSDASFDIVVSFDVLEHIPEPDDHLAEVRRVLRPNGSYLVQTPNKWTNTVFETIRWRSFTRWRQDHCSLHSLAELKARLARHGFEVRVFDVPVVNDFFRRKVHAQLGAPGLLLLKLVNPDRLPLAFRTNLYVQAVKR
jgi:O-antigen/teichoic acid export membrane protein